MRRDLENTAPNRSGTSHAGSVLLNALLLAGGIFLLTATASAAIQHVVVIKFKPTSTAVEQAEVGYRSQQMSRKIEGIRSFQWGFNDSTENLNHGFSLILMFHFESQADLEAYATHPAHREFLEFAQPKMEEVLVYDLEVQDVPPLSVPGKNQHLVFFRFKETAQPQQVETVVEAFLSLEGSISGVESIRTGPNIDPGQRARSLTHLFWLTFESAWARDDYLPHPAHQQFVAGLLPILEEAFVVDFTVRSETLAVTAGAHPYQVFQRNSDGTADISLRGVSAGDGPIHGRLLEGGDVLAGFNWKTVGRAEGGHFQALLSQVPTGGEYTLQLGRIDALGNVAGATSVDHLLVGDIWILAGQSNMHGRGALVATDTPHPQVHVFGMGQRWSLAREPLHELIESRDPVHSGRGLEGALTETQRRLLRSQARADLTRGAGLGLPFAKAVFEETGVPIGLIASAHGGTSMAQWDPAGRETPSQSLYGSMIRQVQRAGGKASGVLWYQGESDANQGLSSGYKSVFRNFITTLRADLQSPQLPFLYVQLGRYLDDREPSHWEGVREAQRTLESEMTNLGVISVADLQLDDRIHVGTQGLKIAGRRLARVAMSKVYGDGTHKIGPRLQSATLVNERREIRLDYRHVHGSLGPHDNIKGFTIHNSQGERLWMVYNARVDPQRPHSVTIRLTAPFPSDAVLWYGKGLDPNCNLTDEANMAAPVFGPLTVDG